MFKDTASALAYVKNVLKEVRLYEHAASVLNFDEETICPELGMNAMGDTISMLSNKAYILQKDPVYREACKVVYKNRHELSKFDLALAESLNRSYCKENRITVEMQHEASLTYNRAFVNWLSAKKTKDFTLFKKSLFEVRNIQLRDALLHEKQKSTPYETIFDGYERGVSCKDLDDVFDKCKERLLPLLQKIKASKKRIRTDFLYREVPESAQKKLTDYLLSTIGFDFSRGVCTTTEHPFTSRISKNDVRVTTHYYPTLFTSNMYSVIHEGGHALFEQNQPAENFESFIENEKTMGMHESTSRFYENRIGKSKEFIHLIYPKVCEICNGIFDDVSEQEFYEAVNVVTPSLIRTEADEFTYTFHIIIRYELEKLLVNGNIGIENLPALWNEKYKEYLGIEPQNDAEGVLQDVHWASGFGYFPTYALGNFYGAMYARKMEESFDLNKAVSIGDFKTINTWMKDNVWLYADRDSPKVWLQRITEKELSPNNYLDYLERKYSAIYEL